MRYWEWPSTGHGSHSDFYDYRYRTTWDEESLSVYPGFTTPGGWCSGRLEYDSTSSVLRMNGYWDHSMYLTAMRMCDSAQYHAALESLWNRMLHDTFYFNVNFGATTFQWELMDTVPAEFTSAGTVAVATLCYYAAVSCPTNFHVFVSTANNLGLVNGLKNYFYYDSDANSTMSTPTASTMMEEIQWLRPFAISGFDTAGAGSHSWIVIGYDNTGPETMFRMNLGWSGRGDGWFAHDTVATMGYVFFVNEHGEMIALAPRMEAEPTYYEKPYGTSYPELIQTPLEEARALREAMEDPDVVRVTIPTYDRKVNVHLDEVEALILRNDGYFLKTGDHLFDISEQDFQEIRERRPEIPVEDKRHIIREIDWDRLIAEVEAEWRKRDPAMEDPEGYSKCLDDIAERLQYGEGLPCSLSFYVAHWGETPPDMKKAFRLRSLQTPDEWARALFHRLVDHAHKVELDIGQEYEGRRSGSLKIYFEVPDDAFNLPPLKISRAEYRAKHLQDVKTVVEFSDPDNFDTDWRFWELRERLKEFEVEEVRP